MVALAGPPPVNRYGSRKTWAVPDLAHEHRGDQWDRIADHQGEGGEVTGVLHRGEQQRIVEHIAEVGQSDPTRGRDQVGGLEAHHHGAQDRPPREDAEDHQKRQGEQQRASTT